MPGGGDGRGARGAGSASPRRARRGPDLLRQLALGLRRAERTGTAARSRAARAVRGRGTAHRAARKINPRGNETALHAALTEPHTESFGKALTAFEQGSVLIKFAF